MHDAHWFGRNKNTSWQLAAFRCTGGMGHDSQRVSFPCKPNLSLGMNHQGALNRVGTMVHEV